MDNQETTYCCPACGYTRIQATLWVDMNTGSPRHSIGDCGEAPLEYIWCPRCDMHSNELTGVITGKPGICTDYYSEYNPTADHYPYDVRDMEVTIGGSVLVIDYDCLPRNGDLRPDMFRRVTAEVSGTLVDLDAVAISKLLDQHGERLKLYMHWIVEATVRKDDDALHTIDHWISQRED